MRAAEGLHLGAHGAVVDVAHLREEVVLDLVVRAAREERPERAGAEIERGGGLAQHDVRTRALRRQAHGLGGVVGRRRHEEHAVAHERHA